MTPSKNQTHRAGLPSLKTPLGAEVTSHKKSNKVLKSSRNKKDLNDATATPFLVSFSQLPTAKKPTENGAAVTSLRSFLFRDDFTTTTTALDILNRLVILCSAQRCTAKKDS